MPNAPVWYRLGWVSLLGSLLAAADLSTTLAITANANVEGPVAAVWQVVEWPVGAGEPIMTPVMREGGRYEALVHVPDPRAGRYVFRVQLAHEQTPAVVEIVAVQVVPKSVPAQGAADAGGGSGCGGGSGSGLAALVLLWIFSPRGRHS